MKGPNLVKGIKLEGLRALGDPASFAQYYYENNADELVFQDVVASLYDRNSLDEIISKVAKEIFIPLTVGGGIRSVQDIESILRNGADKVSINTAATKNPNLINQAAKEFGSSTICISIEVIEKANGFGVFVDNGREDTKFNAIEWLQRAQDLGAGEIILTSVDREGVRKGIDSNLIEKVAPFLKVPTIYHGGISSADDIKFIFDAGFNGVAIASLFHYEILQIMKKVDHAPREGNFTFTNQLKANPMSLKTTKEINTLKNELIDLGIPVRL